MDLGLTDRVFVVTAASGGLGRATAKQLVAEGARVVLVARRAAVLAEAVEELGPERAVAVPADLADPATAELACLVALRAYGRLDGALVSVGGPPPGFGALDHRGAVAEGVRRRLPRGAPGLAGRGRARDRARPGARLGAVHLRPLAAARAGHLERAPARARDAGQAAGRRARTRRRSRRRADARPGRDRADPRAGRARTPTRRPAGPPGRPPSRCAATGRRRSSAGWPRSCCPPPPRTSPAASCRSRAARCGPCEPGPVSPAP